MNEYCRGAPCRYPKEDIPPRRDVACNVYIYIIIYFTMKAMNEYCRGAPCGYPKEEFNHEGHEVHEGI